MARPDGRKGQPVTFAAAMGAAETGPMELNSAESATCPRCGQEPRLYNTTSTHGRDVMIWIPVDHRCTKK